jgi:hypothetical protein
VRLILAEVAKGETKGEWILRGLSVIVRALDAAGLADGNYSADGNLTGRKVKKQGHAVLRLTVKGDAKVAAPPVSDRQHEQPEAEEDRPLTAGGTGRVIGGA